MSSSGIHEKKRQDCCEEKKQRFQLWGENVQSSASAEKREFSLPSLGGGIMSTREKGRGKDERLGPRDGPRERSSTSRGVENKEGGR